MADLNPSQDEAVRYLDGPCLVIAGAGSGKTRVITAKLAHLIDSGFASRAIAAITFTNKAASEMAERFAGAVKLTAAARRAIRKATAATLTVSTTNTGQASRTATKAVTVVPRAT